MASISSIRREKYQLRYAVRRTLVPSGFALRDAVRNSRLFSIGMVTIRSALGSCCMKPWTPPSSSKTHWYSESCDRIGHLRQPMRPSLNALRCVASRDSPFRRLYTISCHENPNVSIDRISDSVSDHVLDMSSRQPSTNAARSWSSGALPPGSTRHETDRESCSIANSTAPTTASLELISRYARRPRGPWSSWRNSSLTTPPWRRSPVRPISAMPPGTALTRDGPEREGGATRDDFETRPPALPRRGLLPAT